MCRPRAYRRWAAALTALALVVTCGAAVAAKRGAAAAVQGPPAAQFVDGIAAVVNKDVITLGQLAQRTQQAQEQLARQKIAVPDSQTLRRQVLNRMIDEKLEEQEAKRLDVVVSDQQVDAAIKSVADRNKISVENLRVEVGKTGVSWDAYQRQIRQEILLDDLRRRVLDSTVHVTDADIDAYLRTKQAGADLFASAAPQQPQAATAPAEPARQPSGPVMLGLAQILVAVPDGASAAQVAASRSKAEAILAKLRGGADFAAVAAASSDGPDALQGGNLGVKPTDGWPDLFVSATTSLAVGQVTGILKSGNGFHILKVLSRSGASARPASSPAQSAGPNLTPSATAEDEGPKMVTQTHVRQILIKVTQVMSDAQAEQRLVDLRQRIEHGASFATLAKQYSQDASAPQGGDIGWVNPGETVPAFQQAMDALTVGQVSEPVKTQFGWHLIQVLARRTKNMAEDYRREQARRILFERRAGPAFDEWLGQLRGRSYIDNHVDPAANRKSE